MQNLLSSEGIRWAVTNMMQNFRKAPLTEIMLFVFTASLIVESGVTSVLSRRTTLKQRRAGQVTIVVFLVSFAMLAVLTIMPDSLLLSSFGTLSHSPLLYGAYPIVLCILTFCSITYGYLSGRFLGPTDILKATTVLPVRIIGYFVAVLFAAQLVACLQYVFPHVVLLHYDSPLSPLNVLFYYLPLIFYYKS